MRAIIMALLIVASPALGWAGPARPVQRPLVVVPPLAAGTHVRPMSFKRLNVMLDPQQTSVFLYSWKHVTNLVIPGIATQLEAKKDRFELIFHDQAVKAGFEVENDPRDLFEEPHSSSDLAVAGSIVGLVAQFQTKRTLLAPNEEIFNGEARMDVDWQIYSRLEKRVVARIHTSEFGVLLEPTADGANMVVEAAFTENVKALLRTPGFRDAFIGEGRVPGATEPAASLPPIRLIEPPAGARPIADAAKAVAIVFAGDGHGSGFLASSDGYVLTDQHVVGSAKFVKVRWSDGTEVLGEVIRSDRIRDVALVKADPGGRAPLRLRTAAMQPGDTVFAIGAPLDKDFQGTVTRGVVSANRTFDGRPFLQSDVTVNPGNSGGPLLDEQGAVVGLTDLSYRPDGLPSGLNLFTPIGEALKALAVEIR